MVRSLGGSAGCLTGEKNKAPQVGVHLNTALRQGFRSGIPERWGDTERADAEKLFAILRRLGRVDRAGRKQRQWGRRLREFGFRFVFENSLMCTVTSRPG